jgi:hypothetical protein
VLQHGVAAIGRNNAEADVRNIAHMIFVRARHRARMESSDLVVVQIRRDEALRCELFFEHANAIHANAALLQMLAVRREILPHRRHRQRIATEQLQVVRDVARATAEFAAHRRHQEGDIQDVHLVRNDVVLELILEHHDGVVSERSADDGRHVVESPGMGHRSVAYDPR